MSPLGRAPPLHLIYRASSGQLRVLCQLRVLYRGLLQTPLETEYSRTTLDEVNGAVTAFIASGVGADLDGIRFESAPNIFFNANRTASDERDVCLDAL